MIRVFCAITYAMVRKLPSHTQGNYATVGSAIVAIAIVGDVDEQTFRPQWQFKFQAHFDK